MRGSSDDQAWIFANIAFYPPLTALMAVTKYTGHLRRGLVPKPRVGVIGAVKVKTTARTAVWTTAVYGIATVFFTFAHNWLAAGVLLVIGGICNLAAMSITQTVVQLLAPRAKRGRSSASTASPRTGCGWAAASRSGSSAGCSAGACRWR